jgi:BASS family bile acid:Na+ symporter
MLLIVFSIKIFWGGNNTNSCGTLTLDETLILTPFVLGLNILGMYGGFFFAKINHLNKPSQLTVAIETGLQNTAMALSVATTLPNSCEIEKPALVYAMLTFFTAVVFCLIHSDVRLKDIKS